MAALRRLTLLALMGLLLLTSCSPVPSPRPSNQPKAPDPLEWQLAVIRSGGSVQKTDPLVAEFARHLDSLTAKTKQSRQQVADMSVKTWQILRDEVNSREDLLQVMADLDGSIPHSTEIKWDLAEVAALYIVLRKGR